MLTHHCSSSKSEQEPKQEDNLEAGGETMEGVAYWLSLYDLFFQFSYSTQDYQARGGTTQNKLGPPPIIN